MGQHHAHNYGLTKKSYNFYRKALYSPDISQNKKNKKNENIKKIITTEEYRKKQIRKLMDVIVTHKTNEIDELLEINNKKRSYEYEGDNEEESRLKKIKIPERNHELEVIKEELEKEKENNHKLNEENRELKERIKELKNQKEQEGNKISFVNEKPKIILPRFFENKQNKNLEKTIVIRDPIASFNLNQNLPDGRILKGIDNDIEIFVVNNGIETRIHTLKHKNKVTSFSLLSNGYLASCSSNVITLWNIIPDNINLIKAFEAHDTKVFSIIELPGNRFASGDFDGTIKLWGMTKNDVNYITTLKEHESSICNMMVRGKWLVSLGYDKTIKSWDISEDKPKKSVNTLKLEKNTPVTLQISDGAFIADSDEKISIYTR